MIQRLLEMGISDFRVLDALTQVPRHIFLDRALWSRAYENRALTIGYKQTISQPYIVARMTEHLISHTSKRGKVLNQVLEIGSGPEELLDLLEVGGKLVIPVGLEGKQKLFVITKQTETEYEETVHEEVAFVPMLPGVSNGDV